MINQVQFLRPEWFLALIPLAIYIFMMSKRLGSSLGWKSACDASLLPYMLIQSEVKTSRLPLWLTGIAATISIIAAAGPVWEKLPQPVFREQSALVIALDLSRSMDATDVKPTRLDRARLKILDILDANRGAQTALVVYAASAFVVTPLTDDTSTIANLVPTLETALMPAQGSNASDAINKAEKLLNQAGNTHGQVLFVTDGLSNNDIDHFKNAHDKGHNVSILAVGTADGGPIPLNGGFLKDNKGAIVIPKVDMKQLAKAAHQGGGLLVTLQANDSDINHLFDFFNSTQFKIETEKTEMTSDTWREEGPWLLLLVLPLAALWARKGWLLSLPLFITGNLLLTLPENAYALDTNNLWITPDQEAMRAFNKGEVDKAAELFEEKRWKASAYYRAEEYKKAIESLNKPGNSDDYYNRGNAFAKLGRYQEAIAAYDNALKMNKDNEDAAYNRELVKKLLDKQNQQQNNNSHQPEQSNNNQDQADNSQSTPDQQDPTAQNQPQDQNNQQNQEANSEQNNNTGKSEETSDMAANQPQEKDKQQQQDSLSSQNGEAGSDSEDSDVNNPPVAMQDPAASEDEQAMEQWLKRIPDDPGGLLRRKFLYQYNQNPEKNDRQPW